MVRAIGPFSRKKRPDPAEIPPEAAAIVEQLTDSEFQAEKARILGEN